MMREQINFADLQIEHDVHLPSAISHLQINSIIQSQCSTMCDSNNLKEKKELMTNIFLIQTHAS